MMKKRWIAGAMALVFLLASGWASAEEMRETEKRIYFNGILLENVYPAELHFLEPYPDQYLPYAAIARQLGYTTTYDSVNDVITSVKGNNYFQFDYKNQSAYIVKNSQEQVYSSYHFIVWNGTCYLPTYRLSDLLGIEIRQTERGDMMIYDPAFLFQQSRPKFDAVYACLDSIPNLDAYTCEGTGNVQFTAKTDRFGVQINGGLESSARFQKNGQVRLATMCTMPNGFLNLSAIDHIYEDNQYKEYLNTPISTGVYQSQDGIFVLPHDLEDYQFVSLIPSIQNRWYLLNQIPKEESRGWLQAPDSAHGAVSQPLRLLQLADKNYWDIDYLLQALIRNAIQNYGRQGMEAVNQYIDLYAKLFSAPYLSAVQTADGAVTLSYRLTRAQFQALLAQQQLPAATDSSVFFPHYVQPDISVTLQFSGNLFSFKSSSEIEVDHYPIGGLLDDISARATANSQISGSIGPVEIQKPEVKTTAMLEELVRQQSE